MKLKQCTYLVGEVLVEEVLAGEVLAAEVLVGEVLVGEVLVAATVVATVVVLVGARQRTKLIALHPTPIDDCACTRHVLASVPW